MKKITRNLLKKTVVDLDKNIRKFEGELSIKERSLADHERSVRDLTKKINNLKEQKNDIITDIPAAN